MRLGLSRFGTLLFALAIAACAKQQPLPTASFGNIPNNTMTVSTGQQILLDATPSTDPSGTGLSYQWSFLTLPQGSLAKFDAPNQAKTRFTADVPTSLDTKYTIQLVVRNKYYVSEPVVLTVQVVECGANPPEVTSVAVSPKSIIVGTPVQLDSAVDDKDNDAECQATLGAPQQIRYAWKLLDQPAGSLASLRDPATPQNAFTPDMPGDYTVALTVTDSTGRSSAQHTELVQVVSCGNAAPVVNSIAASPQSPNLSQATQLTADFGDPDNEARCGLHQALSFFWTMTSLPAGSQAQLTSRTAQNPSFVPDVPGPYSFTLVMTDDTGRQSAPLPMPFTVLAKNCGASPPTPIVQFLPGAASIGTPVSLGATPNDVDSACGVDDTFSYSWSLVTVPAGSVAQISGANASMASFVPDQGGDYQISVTITASSGVSASAIRLLHVSGCGNNRPSIDALQATPPSPVVSTTTPSNVRVSASVSDLDSSCAGYDSTQTYRWSISQAPPKSNAAIVDPTAKVAEFAPDVAGTYQVRLVVTDATGLSSAPATVNVQTSTCGQSAPQIVSVSADNLTPDPGTGITLFAQASDPDNSGGCSLGQTISLRWRLSSRPAGSAATLSNPLAAKPVLVPDVPGSYQVSVIATDSTGLSSPPAWLTFSTTSCGTAAPTVAVLPSSASVTPFQPVAFSATPADADSSCGLAGNYRYTWRIVSAPDGSSAFFDNPSSTTAAANFTPDLAGLYQLAVTVTDGNGHVSQPAFMNVTVTGCALLPPSAGALSTTAATIGNSVTLSAPHAQINSCVANPSLTSLTYAWTLATKPLGSAAMLDNPAATAPSFTPDVAGAYQAVLMVTDSTGLASAPSYANVAVAACGSSNLAWGNAPELTPAYQEPGGSAGTAAYVGTRVTMSASFTDSAGCGALPVTPYRYEWALISRPQGSAAALDSSSVANPGFVPDLPGDYQIAARVFDALGASLPTRFATVHTANCGSNLPVVAIAAPATLTPSTLQTVALQISGGSASDADADPAQCPARFAPASYSYAWSVSPSAQVVPLAGTSVDFSSAAPGTYVVSVVATASNGLASAPASVSLAVSACGSHAPYIASVSTTVGGAAASRPLVGQNVQVTASAQDADLLGACGDSIAGYAWALVSAPAGSAVSTPAAGAQFNFTPDIAGDFVFSVIATDSRGLQSAPYDVTISTATCAPGAPVLSATSTTPGLGQSITASAASGGDVCVKSPVLAYAWQLLSAPKGSHAAIAASGASVPFVPDVRGAYSLQATAIDQAGFVSAPAQLVINAASCGTLPPLVGGIQTAPAAFNAGDLLALSAALTDQNASCAAGLTQPYRWSWTLLSRPAGSQATLDSTAAQPGFVPDLPGAYQISAQATDALGNVSAPVFATLQTSACGANLPVAAILPAPVLPATQLATPASIPLSLSAALTDADNACPARFHVALDGRWTVLSAPAGATAALTAATGGSTAFSAATAGTYVVGLTGVASNGAQGASATVSIAVTNCGATPPSIVSVVADTSRPSVGSHVTLSATAIDLDDVAGGACGATPLNQTISYAWRTVSAPAGATVSTAGANAQTFGFDATVAGTFVFEVVATDSAGLASQPYRIAVPTGACGPGLTGISLSNATPAVGAAITAAAQPAVIPDGCMSGAPGYSYFWQVSQRPATSSAGFANAALASESFTPDVPGTYVLHLTVTDAGGFSTGADAIVSAGGCAAGPAVGAISFRSFEPIGTQSGTVDRGDSVVLSAPVSGGGCGTTASYSYQWSILSRPAGSASALDQPSAASPGFVADVPNGTWQLELVAFDQIGNASTPVFATVQSSGCGAFAPGVSLTAPATIDTFATAALSASASQGDATCPARFSDLPATFSWSVAQSPAGVPAPKLFPSGASAQFEALAPGAYVVQVIATGSDGVASPAKTAAIAVTNCGYHAPTPVAIFASQSSVGLIVPPASAVDLHVPTDIQLVAQDIDNGGTDPVSHEVCNSSPAQTLSYLWSMIAVPAGSTAPLSNATSATAHIVPDVAGAYQLQVTVTDNTGLSTTVPYTLTASATCGSHAPAAVDAAPTPAFSAVQALTSTNILQTTSLAAQTFAVGFPVQLGQPNVVDADTACGLPATFTYAWTLASPAGSAARLSGPGTATPSFTPDRIGLYKLALTVADTTGLSSTETFTIDVECGVAGAVASDGALPAFSATQTVPQVATTAGTSLNFGVASSTLAVGNVPFYPSLPVRLSANVSDADVAACGYPASISYAWRILAAPAGSAATLDNPASPTPALVPDLPGEYDFELALNDGHGHVNTQDFTKHAGSAIVAVSSCGLNGPQPSLGLSAPVVASAPFTKLLGAGATALLAATSTDVDSTPLNTGTTPATGCGLPLTVSYKWAFTALPAGSSAAFSSTTRIDPSFVADKPGSYGLKLTASDGVHANAVAATITAGLPDATKTTIAFAQNPLPAGVFDTATVTFADASGNALAGTPATLTARCGGSTCSSSTTQQHQSAGASDANGVLTLSLLSTAPQPIVVRALAAGVTIDSGTLTVNPGAPDSARWVLQPSDTIVNDPILSGSSPNQVPLQFILTDAFNNDCTNDSSTAVTMVISADGSQKQNAVLHGTLTQTAVNGVLNYSDLSITKPSFAGSQFTLAVTGPFGNRPLSNGFLIKTPNSAPPVTLQQANPGIRQVTLQWQAVHDNNLAGYNVWVNGVRQGNQVTPLTTQTSFVVTTTDGSTPLADGVQYVFQVTSVDTFGNESPIASSNSLQAVTAPPAPAITSAVAGDSTVTITWGAVSSAASFTYVVQRAQGAGSFSNVANNLPSSQTSFTDNTVQNGSNYTYRVGASSGAGTQFSAATASLFPLPPQPPTPANFTATGAAGKIVLTWTAVSNAHFAAYVIYRGGSVLTTIANINTTAYSDTGLSEGQTFAYQISSTDTFSQESVKANASATTLSPGPSGNSVVQISARSGNTCALLTGGTVDCWGDGTSGQLGDGTSSGSRGTAAPVSGIVNATQVSVGGSHACALIADGTIQCWGSNASGQIGDGQGGSTRTTPSQVSGITSAIAVSAGGTSTCALIAGGSIQCWGDNSSGQVGKNGQSSYNTPQNNIQGSGSYVAVSVGAGGTACALKANGGGVCWGDNSSGQLGNNSLVNSTNPVTVTGLSNAVAIAAGQTHACALIGDGTAFCWGDQGHGKLGNNVSLSLPQKTPVQVQGLTDAIALSAGESASCALRAGGSAVCWGQEVNGQLGDGGASDALVPVAVSGLTGIQRLGTVSTHSCTIQGDGSTRCWGLNSTNQLGDGTGTTQPTPVVSQSPAAPMGSQQLTAGLTFGCSRLPDGSARCWGHNDQGQLGDKTQSDRSTPMAVFGLASADKLAAGGSHTCARHTDGTMQCWGLDASGQLGDGGSGNVLFPGSSVAGLSGVVAAAAGTSFTCAIVTGGGVECWGLGTSGQLGNNSGASSATPVAVLNLGAPAVAITAGDLHACALLADGSAACWGDNTHGQIGDNSNTQRKQAQAVQNVTSAVAISARLNHTCIVLASGAAQCWGAGTLGQLGTGNSDQKTPQNVSGVSGAIGIAAGTTHSCALVAGGTVTCWGDNLKGELGNGVFGGGAGAASVQGLAGPAQALSLGAEFSCAQLASGFVQCWGSTLDGELGNGATSGNQDTATLSSTFQVPPTVPGAPAVTATGGAQSVVVNWTAPASNGGTPITGYTVTLNPGNASQSLGAATLTGSFTGLADATVYTVQVTASNAIGASAAGSATATTTMPAPTLSASGTGPVALSWTAVSAATAYKLFRSQGAGSPVKIFDGAAQSFNDGTSPNTTYTYTVHAYNAVAESADSNARSVTTSLAAPAGLTATAAVGGPVSLSWGSVASATSYRVYRGPGFVNPATFIGTSTSTSFTDASVTPGNRVYAVTAVLNGVESAQSNTATASIVTSGPANPTHGTGSAPSVALDGSGGALTVWTGSSGAIQAIHLDANGAPIESAPLTIGSNTFESQPAVAYGGGHYLVLWTDSSTNITEVLGAFVPQSGTAVGAPFPAGVYAFSAKPGDGASAPALAFDGTFFDIAWVGSETTCPGQCRTVGEVQASQVTTSGSVSNVNGVTLVTNESLTPAVGADPSTGRVLIAMEEGSSTGNMVAVEYSAGSPPTGSTSSPIVLFTAGTDVVAFNPSVAFGSGEFLVAWQDNRNDPLGGTYDMFASRVSAAGTVLDGSGIALSTLSGDQINASAAYDGQNFIVAYQNGDSGGTVDFNRVSPAGAQVSAEATLDSGDSVKLASSGSLRTRVVFESGGTILVSSVNEVASGGSCDAAAECASNVCNASVCQ